VVGASKYFEKERPGLTYFDESVQGLQVDSAVKYRGVEVGRVERIRVAPDHRLIEVVMKIDPRGRLEREYVAQLKTAGITGIVLLSSTAKNRINQTLAEDHFCFGIPYHLVQTL